jgi:hypothetical protein
MESYYGQSHNSNNNNHGRYNHLQVPQQQLQQLLLQPTLLEGEESGQYIADYGYDDQSSRYTASTTTHTPLLETSKLFEGMEEVMSEVMSEEGGGGDDEEDEEEYDSDEEDDDDNNTEDEDDLENKEKKQKSRKSIFSDFFNYPNTTNNNSNNKSIELELMENPLHKVELSIHNNNNNSDNNNNQDMNTHITALSMSMSMSTFLQHSQRDYHQSKQSYDNPYHLEDRKLSDCEDELLGYNNNNNNNNHEEDTPFGESSFVMIDMDENHHLEIRYDNMEEEEKATMFVDFSKVHINPHYIPYLSPITEEIQPDHRPGKTTIFVSIILYYLLKLLFIIVISNRKRTNLCNKSQIKFD